MRTTGQWAGKSEVTGVTLHSFSHHPFQAPIHIAAAHGDRDIMKILLKYTASLQQGDREKRTALHYAARVANFASLSYLLAQNANPQCRDSIGNSPLHDVMSCSTKEGVDLMRVLEEFKAAGVDLDLRNGAGETPLHIACSLNHEKKALWLLRQGVDINLSDVQGETPLHNAAQNGSAELVRVLIQAGASTKRAGAYGTASESARTAGRMDIVQLINELSLERGGNGRCVAINGKEMTFKALQDYRAIFQEALKLLSRRITNRSTRSVAEVAVQAARFQLVADLLDVNLQLVEEEKSSPLQPWSGWITARNGQQSANLWCCVENHEMVTYTTPPSLIDRGKSRHVILCQGNCSFRTSDITTRPTTVTISRVGTFSTMEECYEVPETEVFNCLKSTYASHLI